MKGKSGHWGQFASNVAYSVLIHAFVSVSGISGLIIFGTIFYDFLFTWVFAVPAIAGYPFLGYLILQVLPKRNLFSVFILSLMFAVVSLTFITVTLLSDSYLGLLSFVNLPAYMAAIMLIGLGGTIDFAYAEYFAFFVAAFIPSPLIYLGLRLRMRKEKKQAQVM